LGDIGYSAGLPTRSVRCSIPLAPGAEYQEMRRNDELLNLAPATFAPGVFAMRPIALTTIAKRKRRAGDDFAQLIIELVGRRKTTLSDALTCTVHRTSSVAS
jgi:hypothetical protein